MEAQSFPLRITHAVGASRTSEQVADAQDLVYGPILEWARNSPFHSGILGHSLHPMLTDVTLGCWTGASLLDVAGGPAARRSSLLLVAAGLVAAVPTALAGAGDWAGMTGADRRIGAVHALGTDLAVFLFLGSLIARARGRHRLGKRLAVAGNVVAGAAGFLGGHLALNRGTARR